MSIINKSNVASVREMLRDENDQAIDLLSNYDDHALHYEISKPQTDLNSFVYVHQIPEVVEWRMMDPALNKTAMLILGPSAIGKTEAVRAGLLKGANRQGRELILHEKHVSQMMVTDVLGVPRDDTRGRTVWYPPVEFALQTALPDHQQACELFNAHYRATGQRDYGLMADHPLYAYFWDEVTNPATPSTVHQCFSLWMGNQVASHKLVDDAIHILAGNRMIDGTNSINLAKSAVTRLDMVEAVPSLAGWMANFALVAVTIGDEEFTRIHPTVIAYLHQNSGKFAPNTLSIDPMTAHPSPRTWYFVSELMYANDRTPIAENLLKMMVAGHIGQGETNQFWSFRNYWEELPDVNRLLNSREVANGFGWLPAQWPQGIDVRMIMITQMVAKVNENNAKRFMAFMLDEKYFQKDLSGAAMKMLKPLDKLKSIAHDWTPNEFSQWCVKFRDFLF